MVCCDRRCEGVPCLRAYHAECVGKAEGAIRGKYAWTVLVFFFFHAVYRVLPIRWECPYHWCDECEEPREAEVFCRTCSDSWCTEHALALGAELRFVGPPPNPLQRRPCSLPEEETKWVYCKECAEVDHVLRGITRARA